MGKREEERERGVVSERKEGKGLKKDIIITEEGEEKMRGKENMKMRVEWMKMEIEKKRGKKERENGKYEIRGQQI